MTSEIGKRVKYIRKELLTLCATPIQVSESGVEALAGGGWHRLKGRGTATGERLHATGERLHATGERLDSNVS